MSSIRLLHHSSLSLLLPLQCCNCNKYLAHVLLLVSSLLSAFYRNISSRKYGNNNLSSSNRGSQAHDQQEKQHYKQQNKKNSNNPSNRCNYNIEEESHCLHQQQIYSALPITVGSNNSTAVLTCASTASNVTGVQCTGAVTYTYVVVVAASALESNSAVHSRPSNSTYSVTCSRWKSSEQQLHTEQEPSTYSCTCDSCNNNDNSRKHRSNGCDTASERVYSTYALQSSTPQRPINSNHSIISSSSKSNSSNRILATCISCNCQQHSNRIFPSAAPQRLFANLRRLFQRQKAVHSSIAPVTSELCGFLQQLKSQPQPTQKQQQQSSVPVSQPQQPEQPLLCRSICA